MGGPAGRWERGQGTRGSRPVTGPSPETAPGQVGSASPRLRPWEPPAAARQRPINHGDDPSLGRRNPAALRTLPARAAVRVPACPRAAVT